MKLQRVQYYPISEWEVQRTEPGKQGHSHHGPFNLAKLQEYLSIHWDDFKKVKMLWFLTGKVI